MKKALHETLQSTTVAFSKVTDRKLQEFTQKERLSQAWHTGFPINQSNPKYSPDADIYHNVCLSLGAGCGGIGLPINNTESVHMTCDWEMVANDQWLQLQTTLGLA